MEIRMPTSFLCGVALSVGVGVAPAASHEIYTDLHSKTGTLCCGGSDCGATTYRERGDAYEFLTREGHWIRIPQERIQFIPIPGDEHVGQDHLAHLCYRAAGVATYDATSGNVFGDGDQSIYLYCAFIPPGAT